MRLLKKTFRLMLVTTILISMANAQRSGQIQGPDSSFRDQNQNPNTQVPGNANYTLVFSIPLGIEGVNYEKPGGLTSESETWGPTGLRIASDNTLLVIDTVTNAILRYSAEGTKIDRTVVAGAEAISDATLTPSGLFVLDDAGEQPLVYRVGKDGLIQETVALPYESRIRGLSGIVANEQGEVMAEMRGGDSVATLSGRSQRGKAIRGHVFSTELPALRNKATEMSVGAVFEDQKRIPITVKNTLGGLTVLGEGKGGDFYVLVEELSNTTTLFVDQTVHHFSPTGVLIDVARVPLSERFTYVKNGVSVGPDGKVYALITRADRADVVLLNFEKTVTSILPDSEAAQLESELEENSLSGQSDENALHATACRTRDEMIDAAWNYVNNKVWLTDKNLNGSCSGRIKPRYLTKAADYNLSVPYKWGGDVTVQRYNSDMAQGLSAGHIPLNDEVIRSCASGVDCSGFVNNCWATSRHTTSTLKNISTPIPVEQLNKGDIINRAGVHVVMVESLANGGIYTLEATTYNNYDRVVHIWNGWSRFKGYTFYKYNNVCNTAPAKKVATPNISPGSLSSQSSVKATISTSTSGATIRYTTNGADPTASSSIYSGPLSFNANVTLKAVAFKDGFTNSDVASVTYSFAKKVATPKINPGSLSSQKSVKATISISTSGATIRYTTNGADPTSSSKVYSGPLTFNSTVTLKVRGFKKDFINSDVASVTYSIVPKPSVDRLRYNPNPAKVNRVVTLDISGKNFLARTTEVWFVGPGCSGSGCRTNAVNVRNSSNVTAQAVLKRSGSYTVNIRNGNGAWVKAGKIKVVK